ncbi:hypothetical protein [Acetobacter okinawensis]|uniref:hypothetical protein n=1 Tax=Acetobacter okinawensis TaxID=1076594 RepID=UPI000471B529|nr:hypothetical protein [Acetobacter okinawensis]
MNRRNPTSWKQEAPHKISRAAALLELDGEAVVIKLSAEAWSAVLAIAAKDAGGEFAIARVPNQTIFDVIGLPEQTSLRKRR